MHACVVERELEMRHMWRRQNSGEIDTETFYRLRSEMKQHIHQLCGTFCAKFIAVKKGHALPDDFDADGYPSAHLVRDMQSRVGERIWMIIGDVVELYFHLQYHIAQIQTGFAQPGV